MKKKSKQIVSTIIGISMAITFSACGSASSSTTAQGETPTADDTTSYDELTTMVEEGTATQGDYSTLDIDGTAWQYDADNDVYWQIGVIYCSNPEATDYESCGIYVPGAYMNATDNGDGTYTCTVSEAGTVAGYTAETAPIVIPVNTPGYSACTAPSSYSYSSVSSYMEAGFVYVQAGCRGRNNGTNSDGSTYAGGAPWGVTDLKACVRYIRYNSDMLPGDTESIFTFGHSGGGAQSSLMGATGDSELYLPYLEEIGAAIYDKSGNYISDAVAGAMCWCPITSLDIADEAYEWMLGQYSTSGTRSDDTWTSALSDDMAEIFADYINNLGLANEDGTILTLEAADDGIYTSGTYYDYLVSVIEESLNNFLTDTTFPYTAGVSTETFNDGVKRDESDGDSETIPGGGSLDEGPLGDMDGAPSGDFPDGDMDGVPSGNLPDDNMGGAPSDSSSDENIMVYATAADYIASLNSDEEWIIYDETTNTATITSIEAFVNHCKTASKTVCAFDALDASQAENAVFGNGEDDSLHFDSIITSLLSENASDYEAYSDYDTSYAESYAEDMDNTDSLGTSTQVRQNMYNPLYYILSRNEGYGTSTLAKYWRINTGIEQGDTSLTTEVNLALALSMNDSVESVDFTTVWEQGHTEAERTGSNTENFIAWVNECLGV